MSSEEISESVAFCKGTNVRRSTRAITDSLSDPGKDSPKKSHLSKTPSIVLFKMGCSRPAAKDVWSDHHRRAEIGARGKGERPV